MKMRRYRRVNGHEDFQIDAEDGQGWQDVPTEYEIFEIQRAVADREEAALRAEAKARADAKAAAKAVDLRAADFDPA